MHQLYSVYSFVSFQYLVKYIVFKKAGKELANWRQIFAHQFLHRANSKDITPSA